MWLAPMTRPVAARRSRCKEEEVINVDDQRGGLEFLASRRVAVTGVSREPQSHGSNVVYRRLRERGYDVFAVNPNATEVEGDPSYRDLGSIPGGVDAVVIATRPERADETMRQCADLGIRQSGCTAAPARGASRRRRPSTAARMASPSSTAAARACSSRLRTSGSGDARRLHAGGERPEGGLNRSAYRSPVSVEREGGCSCGAVRYRLTSDPLITHCCHCLNCQRQTGSAFVINTLIEADRVELLAGVPEPVPVPRDDGSMQTIHRCPTCHVAVYSEYGRPGCASSSRHAGRSVVDRLRTPHLHALEARLGQASGHGARLRGLLRHEGRVAAAASLDPWTPSGLQRSPQAERAGAQPRVTVSAPVLAASNEVTWSRYVPVSSATQSNAAK